MLWIQGKTNITDKCVTKWAVSLPSWPLYPLSKQRYFQSLMTSACVQGLRWLRSKVTLVPWLSVLVHLTISPLGSSLTTSRPFRHTTFPVAASTNTKEGMLVTLYLFHSFIWKINRQIYLRLENQSSQQSHLMCGNNNINRTNALCVVQKGSKRTESLKYRNVVCAEVN